MRRLALVMRVALSESMMTFDLSEHMTRLTLMSGGMTLPVGQATRIFLLDVLLVLLNAALRSE